MSEVLKYGGVGMVKMLGKLYALIWKEVRANEMERRTYSLACLRKGIRKIQVIVEVLRF